MQEQTNQDRQELPYNTLNGSEVTVPKETRVTEPLPESERPRKDGPGGE